MEKREVLDRLEEIADSMDSDFLNRQEIEAIVDDIKDLQWQLNANTKAVSYTHLTLPTNREV